MFLMEPKSGRLESSLEFRGEGGRSLKNGRTGSLGAEPAVFDPRI